MIDEIDESLPCNREINGYTLGRMGVHNVVVAVMPEISNNRAAVLATQLLNDFPSIRFRLLVGIGSGIPAEDEDEDEDDIRLGDVVVSKPTATFGGVVQYDMGKVTVGGLFPPNRIFEQTTCRAQRQSTPASGTASETKEAEFQDSYRGYYTDTRRWRAHKSTKEHIMISCSSLHVHTTEVAPVKTVTRPNWSD